MKLKRKLALVLMVSIIMGMAASCSTTGQYMQLSKDENVIGVVQATFVVKSSLFFLKSAKDAVNVQAYIKLMEAAGEKFPGNVDIRDITWVTGKSVYLDNTEVSATGRVVQLE
ncbi:MAG: hypothetical protein FWG46_07735 [Treponema sp.]|nr:hypothetical protein [Treponema sp.]